MPVVCGRTSARDVWRATNGPSSVTEPWTIPTTSSNITPGRDSVVASSFVSDHLCFNSNTAFVLTVVCWFGVDVNVYFRLMA